MAAPPPRGLLSCLYSKCDDALDPEDPRQAVCDLIVDLYEEAFARMPITDMAADGAVDMVRLIKDGGDCLGLLDPVSNIILNAASILPPGFASSSSASSTPRYKRNPRVGGTANRERGPGRPYGGGGTTAAKRHDWRRNGTAGGTVRESSVAVVGCPDLLLPGPLGKIGGD